eukprot:Nk52_evm7s2402 gene=Nk52_evmTU7s2402
MVNFHGLGESLINNAGKPFKDLFTQKTIEEVSAGILPQCVVYISSVSYSSVEENSPTNSYQTYRHPIEQYVKLNKDRAEEVAVILAKHFKKWEGIASLVLTPPGNVPVMYHAHDGGALLPSGIVFASNGDWDRKTGTHTKLTDDEKHVKTLFGYLGSRKHKKTERTETIKDYVSSFHPACDPIDKLSCSFWKHKPIVLTFWADKADKKSQKKSNNEDGLNDQAVVLHFGLPSQRLPLFQFDRTYSNGGVETECVYDGGGALARDKCKCKKRMINKIETFSCWGNRGSSWFSPRDQFKCSFEGLTNAQMSMELLHVKGVCRQGKQKQFPIFCEWLVDPNTSPPYGTYQGNNTPMKGYFHCVFKRRRKDGKSIASGTMRFSYGKEDFPGATKKYLQEMIEKS